MAILDENYREYKLNNDLVVALYNTNIPIITARLKVNYAPHNEKEGEEGLAHFLEHCLVSGGSSRYNTAMADETRSLFRHFNVSTIPAGIIFDGRMLLKYLENWLDYTSDHVFSPRFDSDRFNAERERVIREISDAKSSAAYPAEVKFMEVLYRGHPKGRSNLGKEGVVANASPQKLADFHKKGYYPNNMNLILVGGLPNNIGELVQQFFGHHPAGENKREKFPELKPLPKKTILHYPAPEGLNSDNPDESSAQIELAYLGPPNEHKDWYAANTMNEMLGGDSNSLLFQNMSLKKKLAYHVGTMFDGSYNAGDLRVIAAVSARRIDEAINAIFEEMDKMRAEKASEKEIEKIKMKAEYDFINRFQSNEGYLSAIETKLDEGITPEMHVEEYNKITPERVLEVANKYLPDKNTGKYVLYIRDPLKKTE